MADSPPSILPTLAAVAKERRLAVGKKRVHVAALADVDQSTITRFEAGHAWPRDPDGVVNAYAEVTDTGARDIWAEAVTRWQAIS